MSSVNSDRKKRKKMHHQTQTQTQTQIQIQIQNQNQNLEWRSDAQQQIYSSKLLRALQQARLGGGSSSRRVHEAANRVLAAAARGRSRWSRAILTSRLKLKFIKKKNIAKQQRKLMTVITSRAPNSGLKSKGFPARVLSMLVPGCRRQPLPVVLEEATDYIAALQMQVRAMSALADLLCVSGSSSGGFAMAGIRQLGSSPTPPRPYS